jgi:hypothetical protein
MFQIQKKFLSAIFNSDANQQAIALSAMALYQNGRGAQRRKYRPLSLAFNASLLCSLNADAVFIVFFAILKKSLH